MSNNSKTQWTNEQRDAIDIRNKNLLISAAAGSGKTAVLTERIVELIDIDKVDIGSMLIVTFTNAAAAEMKKRIQKKLQERLENYLSSDDFSQIEFLNSQIENVSRASISTVHSFCIKILRENFTEIGIDPSFKIIDETYAQSLKTKALEEVLDREYELDDKDFFDLVDAYSDAKSDRNLKKIILQIERFTTAQEKPYEWLQEQKEFYRELAEYGNFVAAIKNEKFNNILKNYGNQIILKLDMLVEIMEKALDGYEDYEDKSFDILRGEQAIYKELRTLAEENIIDFINNFKKDIHQRLNKPKTLEKEDWEPIKKLRDEAKKIYGKTEEELIFVDEKIFFSDIKYLSRILGKLIDLVMSYKQNYFEIKMQNLFMDFSDIEHLTLKVLENEKIRKSLQEKYQYIFYDEYQDTNRVQEAIINAIKRDNNLFFVGDVKQSIYKFRLADPTIFNEKFKLFASDEEKLSQRIDLSRNFRSTKEILDFCNFIFYNIMTEEFGDVDYKNDGHKLVLGQSEKICDSDVNVIFIDKNRQEESEENQDEEIENISNLELEAIYVAREIEHIILENKKLIQNIELEYAEKIAEKRAINPKDAKIKREIRAIEKEKYSAIKKVKIDYKDICILTRSVKNRAKIFEKTLNKFDLPTFMDTNDSGFEKLEIRCLINYLKIIDNKKQDEAIIGAMDFKFGNFDYEELFAIRNKFPHKNFYMACELYEKTQEDEIAKKLTNFYQNLKEDAIKEKMLSLSDFIWYIIKKYEFDTYVGALENGENRIENILGLIEEAKLYEQNNNYGLFGFLRHIQPLLKGEVEAVQANKNRINNAVSIMSIHKSKGLEYKVVFLCNMSKLINEQDLKDDVIFHNELGVGLRYKDAEKRIQSDNILRLAIREKKRIENISEEIRILYVALTRAEKKLYLVNTMDCSVENIEKIKNKSFKDIMLKGKSYTNFVAPIIFKQLDENKIEELQNTITTSEKMEMEVEGVKFRSKIYTEEELKKKEEKEFEYIDYYDILKSDEISCKKTLDKYDNFEYKYNDEVNKQTKTSISELIKDDFKAEYEFKINRPDFSKNATFSKTQIGTIVHSVMQHIPLKKYGVEELKKEIQKLVDIEKLLPEESEVINFDSIIAFFDSKLGERLLKSKKVNREQGFLMKVEDYIAEGIIDCYFEEDGKIIIIDYKTDATIDKNRHRPQLELYKKAVEGMENKEVSEAYVYWINHNKYINVL